MALKVRTIKKSVWVEYNRDGETAKFLVKPLTMKETNGLLEKNRRYERVKGEVMEKTNNIGFVQDRVDAMIESWDGPILPDGSPLECNRENKIILLETEREMIDWVLEQGELLGKQFAEESEGEQKNSKRGAK